MIHRSQSALSIAAVQSHLHKSFFISEVIGHQYLVVVTDAQFAKHLFRYVRAGGLYEIVELHLLRILDGFSIDVHLCIFDLQGISRQADAAFYIVLAAVDRTYHNITVHLRIGTNQITAGIVIKVVDGTLLVARQTVHIDFIGIYALSFPVSQAVKIFLLSVKRYRITRRKVEHDNVIQFYFSETRYAFVFPLRPFNVRFGVEYRQSVLCQRHGKRCVRYTRTVAHFTYIQKVTHQQ